MNMRKCKNNLLEFAFQSAIQAGQPSNNNIKYQASKREEMGKLNRIVYGS